MASDPSPEERAVEVLAEALSSDVYAPEAVAKLAMNALSAAGLYITDQPGQDALHEAQMEAEHYREQLARYKAAWEGVSAGLEERTAELQKAEAELAREREARERLEEALGEIASRAGLDSTHSGSPLSELDCRRMAREALRAVGEKE